MAGICRRHYLMTSTNFKISRDLSDHDKERNNKILRYATFQRNIVVIVAINTLPNDKFLDLSRLRVVADDKIHPA